MDTPDRVQEYDLILTGKINGGPRPGAGRKKGFKMSEEKRKKSEMMRLSEDIYTALRIEANKQQTEPRAVAEAILRKALKLKA